MTDRPDDPGTPDVPEVVAGRPPVEELLQAVRAEPPGLVELDVAGWHAVATPVSTGSSDPVSTTTRTGRSNARAKSRSRWSCAGTAMIAPWP